jgi:Tfp pilus assembly protein PilV
MISNRFKKLSFYISSENGLSLLEILASVTILFILTLSLVPMFAQSARTNNVSEDMIDSTYIAESSMETIENLFNLQSTTITVDQLPVLITKKGYTVTACTTGTCFDMDKNNRYIFVQLINSPGSGSTIVNVKVKVYNDRTKTHQLAQMETLLSWKNP